MNITPAKVACLLCSTGDVPAGNPLPTWCGRTNAGGTIYYRVEQYNDRNSQWCVYCLAGIRSYVEKAFQQEIRGLHAPVGVDVNKPTGGE